MTAARQALGRRGEDQAAAWYVAHGYEVLGNDEMVMVYYTNQHYNPADEHRFAHDDPEIGWTWWGIEHR